MVFKEVFNWLFFYLEVVVFLYVGRMMLCREKIDVGEEGDDLVIKLLMTRRVDNFWNYILRIVVLVY